MEEKGQLSETPASSSHQKKGFSFRHLFSSTSTSSPSISSNESSRRGVDNDEKLAEDDAPTSTSVKIEEKADDVKPVSFFSLFRFSRPHEIVLNILGVLAAIVAGTAQPLMTIILGKLTQSFVSFGAAVTGSSGTPSSQTLSDAIDEFKKAAAKDALILVIIGIALAGSTWFYMVIWTYTGEITAKRVRERYLQAVLRQDIAFFDNVGAGEVTTRIQTDTRACNLTQILFPLLNSGVDLVQEGISEKVPLAIQFISAFVSGFVVAYIRSWRLALVLTSIFPCIAITGSIMNMFASRWTQLSLQHSAVGGTLAEEVISTIRTAQAFGTQNTLANLYEDNVDEGRKVDMKTAVVYGVGLGVFFFIIYSAYALAFFYGTILIIKGRATVGLVVNVFTAILIGSFSLAILAPMAQAITSACGAAAKLFATIDRVPSIDSLSEEGLRPAVDAVRGQLSFKDVMFNYPSRPDVKVLNGVSMEFQAGKTAALVGASGSGKSTVVSLIERFYDVASGSIMLDGVKIKDLNVNWLRSQIGLVLQEPTLFSTSIRGNVAHGLIGSRFENLPNDEKETLIQEACIKANAHGFIQKLPNGYDTLVGERGFLLSGGQKQRIAIARAIISDPRILLLDEATSALDTQSEGIVQNALDKAAAGRTTITIAHRLSTIRDADQIWVMGNGEVLEHGTHNELLAVEDGAYSNLVIAQGLREADERKELGKDDLGLSDLSHTDTAQEPSHDYEKQAMEEIPLGRRDTGQSLASAILKRKEASATLSASGSEDKEYSFSYLFKRMGGINSTSWPLYVCAVTAAVVTGSVYPAFGIVYAKAVTTFQLAANLNGPGVHHQLSVEGNRNALWLFLISIVSAFATAVQNFLFSKSAAILTSKLRVLAFRAILRQDSESSRSAVSPVVMLTIMCLLLVEYFDQERHSTGSLTSGLSENAQKVNGLAGITLGTIVQSVATVVVGLIIGLAYAPKISAVGIACVPFFFATGYFFLRVVVLKDKVNKRYHEESAQMACEAAGSIRTVASLTREKDCCNIYSQHLDIPLRKATRTSVYATAFFALSQSMQLFCVALVFWYGSRLLATGEYNTNQFFVSLMSVTFGAIQAGNAFGFVPDISAAKGAASDIITLLDSRPVIDAEDSEGKTPQDVQGKITVKDIHFRYPTRPEVRVLRGLDITANPGTYIALVGASGCGKSTVIQLIERFYDPLSGKVLLDDQEIDEFNIQEYRKYIALVSQEPTLYAGTIKFNVQLGATKPLGEVTQEEIEGACRDANILEFIKSLPDGFETDVGGKGTQLSGGQKQRIAIARALLRNPKVLLLDEATSALDSQSEKVVQEALDQAAKGRTTIAIAHRLSTIQNADCIYFIKDGCVFEQGTHDYLTSKRGAYYEYTKLQQLSKLH